MSWHNDSAHAHITVTVRNMIIANVWRRFEQVDT
jgi:hypothetical protein